MALDVNPGPRDVTLSGLSDMEAREFHSLFMTSFIVFTAVAVVAHILVWLWRPWLPGDTGYRVRAAVDSATEIVGAFASLVA